MEGIAKITTSFDDDKDPISIPQEITGSIAESFGASEETIEKVKNITDAAETVGELLMPGKAVIQGVSILIDKTGVADPLLESIDDAVNQPSKPDENGMNKENF